MEEKNKTYDLFYMLTLKNDVRPSDVSKETGISSTVFSEWKKGKSQPKSDKVVVGDGLPGVDLPADDPVEPAVEDVVECHVGKTVRSRARDLLVPPQVAETAPEVRAVE